MSDFESQIQALFDNPCKSPIKNCFLLFFFAKILKTPQIRWFQDVRLSNNKGLRAEVGRAKKCCQIGEMADGGC